VVVRSLTTETAAMHSLHLHWLLVGLIWRFASWLWPWLSVVVLSAMLTSAAGQSFAPNSSAHLDSTRSAEPSATEPLDVFPVVSGRHWMVLWLSDSETHISCLTTSERVSADMMLVSHDDFERLAAELCAAVPNAS
jgi:hypothetical protein